LLLAAKCNLLNTDFSRVSVLLQTCEKYLATMTAQLNINEIKLKFVNIKQERSGAKEVSGDGQSSDHTKLKNKNVGKGPNFTEYRWML
jgi:hypothetical protein